jgi:hypothetical protein
MVAEVGFLPARRKVSCRHRARQDIPRSRRIRDGASATLDSRASSQETGAYQGGRPQHGRFAACAGKRVVPRR